jgi:hypothetical protein
MPQKQKSVEYGVSLIVQYVFALAAVVLIHEKRKKTFALPQPYSRSNRLLLVSIRNRGRAAFAIVRFFWDSAATGAADGTLAKGKGAAAGGSAAATFWSPFATLDSASTQLLASSTALTIMSLFDADASTDDDGTCACKNQLKKNQNPINKPAHSAIASPVSFLLRKKCKKSPSPQSSR